MRIRIAQQGWTGHLGAETVGDVEVGLGLPWVEIDGHRFDVQSVVFAPSVNEAFTAVTIEFSAAVEIVYVDRHGDPLPYAPVTVGS